MEREADLNRFFDDINVKVVFLRWTEGAKLVDRQPFWTILNKLHE